MPVKKPALGRGLDALFTLSAPTSTLTPPEALSLRQLPVDQIRPNPYQPRENFDPVKMGDLAESIRQKGILQPIIVRERGDRYEIVAGERRWRAAQQAGLDEVPVLIRDFGDREMMEAALVENIQRDDLNAVEEARAYQRLTEEFELTQEALAETVGKSRVSITNSLRLLRLPPEVLEMIEAQELTAGHGRALLSVEDRQKQISLAKQIVRKGMNVRQAEQIAKNHPREKSNKAKASAGTVRDDVAEMEERLTWKLGLKVKLRPESNTSGRVEIHYTSLDEFQKLCENLGLGAGQAV